MAMPLIFMSAKWQQASSNTCLVDTNQCMGVIEVDFTQWAAGRAFHNAAKLADGHAMITTNREA